MLQTLHLTNFKGIASPQRVDFAPLTLLFGPNSAGKSTILQALLYLHEILQHGNADVDRTSLGGDVIELGGFARLVHRHDTSRAITLRAEFATPNRLERFGRDLANFPFPDLDDDVKSAWLELTIRWRDTVGFRGPLVEQAVVGVEDAPLVWLELSQSTREIDPIYARVNLEHPMIAETAADIAERWELIACPEENYQLPRDSEEEWDHVILPDGSRIDDAHRLPIFALSRSRLSALPPIETPLRVIPFGHSNVEPLDEDNGLDIEIADEVRTFLEMIILGTTAQLATALRDALYIGPLRTIPPRGFLYQRSSRLPSWADGLAAWELLLADRTTLVERTNHWLRRLGAGCQVTVQHLFDRTASAEDITIEHVDRTVRRLLLDTGTGSLVLPSEVGAGISQILPVIVAALDPQARLALVEQPELHVHPAVQVGLGDLFIEAATQVSGRRTLLIETHSEHLILRLLRRIRQTTDGELPKDALPFSPEQLSVLYVEAHPDGVRIQRLRVDEEGEFKDRWPRGFFAERREELL